MNVKQECFQGLYTVETSQRHDAMHRKSKAVSNDHDVTNLGPSLPNNTAGLQTSLTSAKTDSRVETCLSIGRVLQMNQQELFFLQVT